MPRLKYGTILRIIVIIGLFCIWVQIMLSATSGILDRDGESSSETLPTEAELAYEEELMNGNETSEQVLALVPPELHKYLTVHPKNNTANSTERTNFTAVAEIQRLIEKHNDAQTIYNEDVFGPVQEDTTIIAIQVHTRLAYLRHLIVSLAQAKDIDKTLLVFSHDYYDEEINSVVLSIDFTKVMQIFYPYSIQTHPNGFPGVDPNDCARDTKPEEAKRLKCNNALHPDVHGHYREAKYTQTKHHWWWKANRIFNQLQCTQNHTGLVLFLEEDHYVAEDFLYMLDLLRSTAEKNCPQCDIYCLGTYLKTFQYHATSDKRKKQLTLNYIQQVRAANEERRRRQQHDTQSWNFQVYPNLYSSTEKVTITPWHSSMHNMGFAFNRTVWNLIMANEKQFCAYDDYNWDYSLLHLSQNLPGRERFKVIVAKGPRVFHIGECGIHHKKANCNPSTVINKVQKLLQGARKYFFPAKVTTVVSAGGPKQNKKLLKGNGGWGDLRFNLDYDLETFPKSETSGKTREIFYLYDEYNSSYDVKRHNFDEKSFEKLKRTKRRSDEYLDTKVKSAKKLKKVNNSNKQFEVANNKVLFVKKVKTIKYDDDVSKFNLQSELRINNRRNHFNDKNSLNEPSTEETSDSPEYFERHEKLQSKQRKKLKGNLLYNEKSLDSVENSVEDRHNFDEHKLPMNTIDSIPAPSVRLNNYKKQHSPKSAIKNYEKKSNSLKLSKMSENYPEYNHDENFNSSKLLKTQQHKKLAAKKHDLNSKFRKLPKSEQVENFAVNNKDKNSNSSKLSETQHDEDLTPKKHDKKFKFRKLSQRKLKKSHYYPRPAAEVLPVGRPYYSLFPYTKRDQELCTNMTKVGRQMKNSLYYTMK